MLEFPLVVAVLAGLVSFLSPCVLPLVPGYLVYLASAAPSSTTRQRSIFWHSVSFASGFSTVFAAVGVLLTTVLEYIAYDAQVWLARIGGTLIVLFGLYIAGFIKLPSLNRPAHFKVQRHFSSPYITSAVFGAAFAAGWTPCVGAVLGSILGLAITAPGSAFFLLLAYAAGFSVPFILVGLFTEPATAFIHRFGALTKSINRLFGIFLVIIGILMFTQTLSRFVNIEIL